MKLKKSVFFNLVASLLVALLAGAVYSQTCALTIEATPEGSEVVQKGVTASAISKTTGRIYRSTFRQGLPFFASLPEAEYKVTIKKVGFKRTVDIVKLDCDEAENGTVTSYFSIWRGSSNQSVDLTIKKVKEMRLDRMTMLGSSDSDSPPPPPVWKVPPRTISGEVLNGKAISLPVPAYPPAAKAVRAGGSVSIQVLIDESGNVVAASAVSGHPLLRSASEAAARGARFSPTLLEGRPVKVSGVITYNFVP